LLGWSQRQLAEAANVSLASIKAFEGGRDVRVSIVAAIEAALAGAGVMFQEPGDIRPGGRGVRFREQ
jgi:transcriptional regulator with XRE-family HTH domain